MEKKLDILVVEDDPKHLADAQAEIQKRIAAGEGLSVDFSGIYEQVIDMMKSKRYDGIITDIFFPGDTRKGVPGKVPDGWVGVWSSRCYEHLKDHGLNRPSHPQDFHSLRKRIISEGDKWASGRSMHPSGVLVVDDAIKAGIPVVMCTDTYHHGYSTQPIFSWAIRQNVEIIDSHGEYEGNASFKDWARAFQELIYTINPELRRAAEEENRRNLPPGSGMR